MPARRRLLSLWLGLLSMALIISGIAFAFRIWNADQLKVVPVSSPGIRALMDSAIEQTRVTTGYDPAYVRIPYPGGDVPPNTGVCSDVIIRAFRKAGIDLQVKVHEDMRANFAAYPRQWGLKKPDPSIDHRRVPNLMTYFKRRGKSTAITRKTDDYRPGDVVVWDFGYGKVHTGLVSNRQYPKTKKFLIIHNVGMGTRLEDRLFDWPIIGHYRYFR